MNGYETELAALGSREVSQDLFLKIPSQNNVLKHIVTQFAKLSEFHFLMFQAIVGNVVRHSVEKTFNFVRCF